MEEAEVLRYRIASERQFMTTRDGIVSLLGWWPVFVVDATMALVEDGALPGLKQLDIGNVA